MNIDHTLHYPSTTEAQAAARMLARQGAMIKVQVLPDGRSLRVRYDTPLVDLLIGLFSAIHAMSGWFKHMRIKHPARSAHA